MEEVKDIVKEETEAVTETEKKPKKKRHFLRLAVALLISIVILFLLQRLLMPKYVEGILEGAMVAEYYDEKDKSFDVVFVGDCEVYENFTPVVLWEKYGINSYIRGSAEQYIWQSYYLFEDSLRYYKPKVCVFNIQSLQFNESQSEAYNRMSLEGMRWSKSKVDAINASMTEDEHFIDYVFPILRYHSRWNDLTWNDVKYMFRKKKVTHNGYYMRIDALPAENVPPGRPLANYDFGDKAWEYLDKLRELCDKNGIKLLLIKAPSLYPEWYAEYEAQVDAYAEKYNLPYINFLEIKEEIGIDYTTDTYDGGLHMNLSGAEKLSDYIGPVLRDLGAPDRRGEEALVSIWKDKIADYEAQIKEQEELYGVTFERMH